MTSNMDSRPSQKNSDVVTQAREEFEARLSEALRDRPDGDKLSARVAERSTIEIMRSIAADCLQKQLADPEKGETSESAFEDISSTILSVLDNFGRGLFEIAGRISGIAKSPVRVSELLGSYREMRREIEADLILSRQNFLAGKFATGSDFSKSVVNRGGKPLAKHWDAMWAEIALRLWNGDLQPETQADIKRAMFAWFNSQEIEVGDTAVTQRARQLWLLLEANR